SEAPSSGTHRDPPGSPGVGGEMRLGSGLGLGVGTEEEEHFSDSLILERRLAGGFLKAPSALASGLAPVAPLIGLGGEVSHRGAPSVVAVCPTRESWHMAHPASSS